MARPMAVAYFVGFSGKNLPFTAPKLTYGSPILTFIFNSLDNTVSNLRKEAPPPTSHRWVILIFFVLFLLVISTIIESKARSNFSFNSSITLLKTFCSEISHKLKSNPQRIFNFSDSSKDRFNFLEMILVISSPAKDKVSERRGFFPLVTLRLE